MTDMCIFCSILAGRSEASFVYRDAYTVAFMSLEQPNPYKVLIIPTAHVETLSDLSYAQTAELFGVAVKVARAIRQISGYEGLNLVQSNGKAGQQDVAHVHVHLLPRQTGDDVTLSWPHEVTPRTHLNQLAAELIRAL